MFVINSEIKVYRFLSCAYRKRSILMLYFKRLTSLGSVTNFKSNIQIVATKYACGIIVLLLNSLVVFEITGKFAE